MRNHRCRLQNDMGELDGTAACGRCVCVGGGGGGVRRAKGETKANGQEGARGGGGRHRYLEMVPQATKDSTS